MIFKIILFFLFSPALCHSQTDLFVMQSADFTHPGIRANYNIGIGHTMETLNKVPIGNEMTFSYTYENAGSHGFWHTANGSHTEALGTMRNMPITKTVTLYTWVQYGLTTLTPKVQNRFYSGTSLGVNLKVSTHQSIWIQESMNKIATIPVYSSTGIGYTWSW